MALLSLVAAGLLVTTGAGADAAVPVAPPAPDPSSTVSAAKVMRAAGFVGLTPVRLLDTRVDGRTYEDRNRRAGPLGPSEVIFLKVVPPGYPVQVGVAAFALNLTVTEPTLAGHVTVWPTDQPRPTASSINMLPGQTVANGVITRVAPDGTIALYNATGQAHVIVDLLGWFAVGSYDALTPARALDTRPGGITADGQGSGAGALGTESTMTVPVLGRVGVPATGVAAVAVNLTVAEPSAAGYVTLWPTGEARPRTSSINMVPGRDVANGVITEVGADGTISLYNATGSAHLVVDVLGWFPATGGAVQPLTPARLADSRPGGATTDGEASGGGRLGSLERTTVRVLGRGGVPATGVEAVAVNLTATEPTAASYLTVWPTGALRPYASSLNTVTGEAVANGVISKVGSDGTITIYNAVGSTHLVVDVVGWFPDTSSPVTAITAGHDQTCVLSVGTELWCWGTNVHGELAGGGEAPMSALPIPVGGDVDRVNLLGEGPGARYTCAHIQGWALYCWGANSDGQLGDGTTTDRSLFHPVGGTQGVPPINDPVAVSTGYGHACAVVGSGAVRCWGRNDTGQLGDGTTTPGLFPVTVQGLTDAVSVTVGDRHSCAVRITGTVVCWGDNSSGQLGLGSTLPASTTTPTPVPGLTTATRVVAGSFHTCALLVDRTLRCWGQNADGQIGDGTVDTSTGGVAPTAASLTDVADVALGGSHTCATTTAGGLWCWGRNDHGQLGDGTLVDHLADPTPVAGVGPVSALATGMHHSCAVTRGGPVRCWGENASGQLGDGTTIDRRSPVAVVGLVGAA